MIGWTGDGAAALRPHLFVDADFGGCTLTQRSTSGVHVCIRGENTCFPVAGGSKRQSCVSHSTPEAEMVALDHGLRHHGLPMLTLWSALSGSDTILEVHEDNQAMIRVVSTGRNPTMRYLGRTHRISVAWLHERFAEDDVALVYEVTTGKARLGLARP